jgi:DNA polymerase III sliding clamp (beta) subunit (PCNA family)
MTAGELAALLRPFNAIISKAGLADIYRVLVLRGDGTLYACAPHGRLEARGGPKLPSEVVVETTKLLGVINNLPEKSVVELMPGPNGLGWRCGAAGGRLGRWVLGEDDLPPMLEPRDNPMSLDHEFVDLLKLGSLSCASSAMVVDELRGMPLEFTGRRCAGISSDNETLSCYDMQLKSAVKGKFTLSQPAASLLIAAYRDDSTLEVGDGITLRNATYTAYVPKMADMKWDLRSVADAYCKHENTAKLPAKDIAAFIRRANVIAEEKRRVVVTVEFTEGRMELLFSDDVSETTKSFLCAGVELPDGFSMSLNASLLARALEHVDELVLDFVQKGYLVFRKHSKTGEFFYMMSQERGA